MERFSCKGECGIMHIKDFKIRASCIALATYKQIQGISHIMLLEQLYQQETKEQSPFKLSKYCMHTMWSLATYFNSLEWDLSKEQTVNFSAMLLLKANLNLIPFILLYHHTIK